VEQEVGVALVEERVGGGRHGRSIRRARGDWPDLC
jgi:hypothetical protein